MVYRLNPDTTPLARMRRAEELADMEAEFDRIVHDPDVPVARKQDLLRRLKSMLNRLRNDLP